MPSGYEFTASILYLKPGADNFGWAVVTDFLPVTTPTWHVQTFNVVGISVNNEEVGGSNVTQIVPSVDAKIGVNYNYDVSSNSSLVFELGYMGAAYINPLSSYETNTNVLALDSGSLSSSTIKHTQSNFSVGGPYFTANWLF